MKLKQGIFVNGDYAKLDQDLSKIDWKMELEELNVNEAWGKFREQVNKGMSHNIPESRPSRKSSKTNNSGQKPLWMNFKTLRMVRKTILKKICPYKVTSRLLELCQLKKQVTEEVRKARRSFEKKLAESIKSDPKSFWKYVRSKTKVKVEVSDLERDDVPLLTLTRSKQRYSTISSQVSLQSKIPPLYQTLNQNFTKMVC